MIAKLQPGYFLSSSKGEPEQTVWRGGGQHPTKLDADAARSILIGQVRKVHVRALRTTRVSSGYDEWVATDRYGQELGQYRTRGVAADRLIESYREEQTPTEMTEVERVIEAGRHQHNPAGNSQTSGPFGAETGRYFATYSTCRACGQDIVQVTAVGETPAQNRRAWIARADLYAAYTANTAA